jgi:hypothetical protein
VHDACGIELLLKLWQLLKRDGTQLWQNCRQLISR